VANDLRMQAEMARMAFSLVYFISSPISPVFLHAILCLKYVWIIV